jgi:hypothetical protein
VEVDHPGEKHLAAGRRGWTVDVDGRDPAVLDADAAGAENAFGREDAVRYDFEGHGGLLGGDGEGRII